MTPDCEADTDGKLYFQSALCADEVPAFVLGVTGTDAFPFTRRSCAPADLADKRKFVSNIYYVRSYSVDEAEDPQIPTLVRSEFELDAGGNLVHLESVPLIEGIEAMRVELGIDSLSENGGAVDYGADIDWVNADTKTEANNRGDGVPDGEFVRCDPCDTDQLINVTAVKIYVLARSREETVGYVGPQDVRTRTGSRARPLQRRVQAARLFNHRPPAQRRRTTDPAGRRTAAAGRRGAAAGWGARARARAGASASARAVTGASQGQDRCRTFAHDGLVNAARPWWSA